MGNTSERGKNEPAGFGRRFVALVLDLVILGVLAGMLGVVSANRSGSTIFSYSNAAAAAESFVAGVPGDRQTVSNSYGYKWGYRAGFRAGLILWVLYCGFMLWRFGATPGKMLLGLKVVDAAGGGSLPWDKAFTRSFFSLLSTGVFFLGYLWVLWHKDHMAWHDLIPGTKVVKS